ncbi:MAG: family 16 glycoside hydrolase [Plantibacter flavus]
MLGVLTLSALVGGALLGGGAMSATAALPDQEPGVTLRTFAMPPGISALCTLKSGTTPNVDKLMPQIDFSTEEDFGLEDDFLTHVIANLAVAEAGEHTFRLTSDDGSRLNLDGQVLIDNDGPQDGTSKEATVTLTEGAHPLFLEHFEGGFGQLLKLEWKTPGSAAFEIIPSSALSTDADVVRVTAPGTKYCEGAEDTAGDGLRLDAVNPNYELTDLRPEGFEPKVSGLAFTEADQLLVSTTGSVSAGGWVPDAEPGEVFRLDNVVGDTSADEVEVTKIASDLLNPMGIDVIGDLIYVSERHQLTELSDPDGDGFYDTHTKLAEWPDGGNFHEFAFGLIHDEENFYLNLSVAIDNGGATTNPQPAENRGTALKVNRETGEVDYIAGGLRTPNGIAFGPGDELFAMDNQGGWLPSSKLVNVREDRFFNHFTTPAGPFDDQPVSPPALWIPQNEIGNSPSTPITLDEGPFAGQMLFGDVTYGGLQRGFLEEIDGEYQGAVFRHTAGLEVGVNRVITGPDGALYVGGTGEGGNWGESGKQRFGLQKLSPVSDETFDMESVSVVEGGFDIRYTSPISEETAEGIAEAYRAEQWRYVPTSQYGGPKVDEQNLIVESATVSDDRMTVTVQLEGLAPGNVVHLRSPRPFTSESGQELWSTEAWYTLNSLPGYEAPADRGWYEAETASITGSAGIDTEHNGYSGSGFVDSFDTVGAGVTFPVTVETAGTYPLNLRYANGPNPFEGEKDISLYVNGEKVGPWTLPSTADWKTWSTATRDVELRAGSNAVALRYDEGDDGNVNLDVLSVGTATDICTPASIEDGYTGLFDGTLASFDEWRLAGPGSFGRQADCSLRTSGGLGLLWYEAQELTEYSLKLDWKLVKDDNGGIFVGFPNPGNDPWIAVNEGYEIQIDATDEDDRTTGAIYTFQGADLEARDAALNPVGQWNEYEIIVEGQTIKVILNGTLINDFVSTDPARDLSQGFIGLQNHGSGEAVSYRNVRVKELTTPTELAVSVTTDVRCVAGKAFVTARGTNDADVPVDIELSTPYGERTIEGVEPGASAFHSFTTRLASVPAGSVTATASADGQTGEAVAEYAATTCR